MTRGLDSRNAQLVIGDAVLHNPRAESIKYKGEIVDDETRFACMVTYIASQRTDPDSKYLKRDDFISGMNAGLHKAYKAASGLVGRQVDEFQRPPPGEWLDQNLVRLLRWAEDTRADFSQKVSKWFRKSESEPKDGPGFIARTVGEIGVVKYSGRVKIKKDGKWKRERIMGDDVERSLQHLRPNTAYAIMGAVPGLPIVPDAISIGGGCEFLVKGLRAGPKSRREANALFGLAALRVCMGTAGILTVLLPLLSSALAASVTMAHSRGILRLLAKPNTLRMGVNMRGMMDIQAPDDYEPSSVQRAPGAKPIQQRRSPADVARRAREAARGRC